MASIGKHILGHIMQVVIFKLKVLFKKKYNM